MINNANISFGSQKKYDIPVERATGGKSGVNIKGLKEETGYLIYDNGFANTAGCKSEITYIDGDKSILRHRGYDIEDLVTNCTFVEVAYLLVHGSLPTERELKRFSKYLNKNSMIHENMLHFFNGFPADSHPMTILASMVSSLVSFYPQLSHKDPNFDITAARIISKVRTIAAFSFQKSQGRPVVYPRYDLSYCSNFLNMMFSSPVDPYKLTEEISNVLNKLLILHVDHSQNASTTAVRLVGSTHGSLYSAITAGISALSGPRHGGANQAVIEMLNKIKNDSRNIKKYINKAKNPDDDFRLMGVGHAVYKNYDPRAKIAKKICSDFFKKRKATDPLLDIALELEEKVLKDDYFIERKLYPNIDFYTGILYRAIGIPTNMSTVMFALGRLPGWIAQWYEQVFDDSNKIFRPRQIYTGPVKLKFVPIKKRKKGEAIFYNTAS